MHPIAIKLLFVDVENKVNQIVETGETLGNIFHIIKLWIALEKVGLKHKY